MSAVLFVAKRLRSGFTLSSLHWYYDNGPGSRPPITDADIGAEVDRLLAEGLITDTGRTSQTVAGPGAIVYTVAG